MFLTLELSEVLCSYIYILCFYKKYKRTRFMRNVDTENLFK